MPATTVLARTPLHAWHAGRGARFIEADGWQLAAAYAGADPEVEAARAGLAVADVSAFAKMSLIGPAVRVLTWSLVGMGAAMKPHGVAPFNVMSTVLACRLRDDQLLLLASAPSVPGLDQYLKNITRNQPVVHHHVTSAYAAFWLVGPHADDLLRRVVPLDVSESGLPVDSCTETSVAGVHALLVRSSELELPSLRLHVAWDVAEYVWDRLFDAGRAWKVAPLGLEALGRLQKPRAPAAPFQPPGMPTATSARPVPGLTLPASLPFPPPAGGQPSSRLNECPEKPLDTEPPREFNA